MVTVEFRFEPEEPDEGDDTGMSEAEFERLTDHLMQLGAEDIKVSA